MKIFGFDIGFKSTPVDAPTSGDVPKGIDAINSYNDSVMKAYMPEYLFNPPFGYPRGINYPLTRHCRARGGP